ncbi:formamidase [Corynebacterium uberis]|uniref:formamidase n=1 Tax=Corynebacterium TaxID=1716 RepID=UPI001D09BA08|nr:MULTISPECIES: formamidase [Corynebacterium]MCZ9310188.1 formamidase [Corynebacterium sp. c6VSa_13]UDL73326.1 formamidase [Corynebacterium uberis]UDL75796.1 formamidase [Corynebacterium uberis]UDL78009.1 formamidase [Corynebacterium uberis]UDL80291.1 formamidase [Corynebacterium uberis]
MSSTGSVSASPDGLLMALVQYPVPVVNGPEDIQTNVDNICRAVASTKAGYPDLDLIVFPEYSTSGLNTAIWSYDEMLLGLDSPEVGRYKQACKDNGVWGVFSIMEPNDTAGLPPYNTAIIINSDGEIALHYRKLQPWVPIEPWYPGDVGMPVCDGPKGSKLAVCICHDGMFPELAREAAYKGANVYIRISGYSTQVSDQWIMTNRTNAWQNLMFTASVNLAGYDGTFYYFGEGNVCNYDGHMIAEGHRNPWEIVTAEVFPTLADKARENFALENNIYNLGARGYVGKPGGERANYLTWVADLAAGNYHVPWEDKVRITDGWKYYPEGPKLGPLPQD